MGGEATSLKTHQASRALLENRQIICYYNNKSQARDMHKHGRHSGSV